MFGRSFCGSLVRGLVTVVVAAGAWTVHAAGTYVEYVQSQRTLKQHLDTGYIVKPTTKVIADFSYWNYDKDATKQQRLYGVQGSSGGISFHQYINGSGYYAYSCTNNVDNGWWQIGPVVTTNRVKFTISIPDRMARTYTTGDTRSGAGSFGPVSNNSKLTLALFCYKKTDGSYNAANEASVRLWSFRIYEGETLVKDFRPYKDENGKYCLTELIDGGLFYPVNGSALAGGEPIEDPAVTEARQAAARVTLAPGYNVTTNVPAFGGTWEGVWINEALKPGGLVAMDPNNWYNADTYFTGGTLLLDNLQDATVTSLGGAGTLYLDAGTVKYTGTGTFARPIETRRDLEKWGTTEAKATIFDVTGDLTLAGGFKNTRGGFVKTGPGILRIPGGSGTTTTISALGGNGNLNVEKPTANGDSWANGSAFEILEGTLVLGENGGTFNINGNTTDAWIGKATVDPNNNPNNEQEKDACIEVRGGRVVFQNWTMFGVKSGFVGNTPNGKPWSGIRVYGGTCIMTNNVAFGRNKSDGIYKDKDGKFLQVNCGTFIEVHGGTLQMLNSNSRVSIAENSGVETRVWVDGGTLIVYNANMTTGNEMLLGNATEGDPTVPSAGNIFVCSNGVFDVTGLRIVNNARENVTGTLTVFDGGVYRNNTLIKGSTKASNTFSVLFDGGIGELRYGGYANWIKEDVTKGEIGTRGAIFRVGNTVGANAGVIDSVNIPFQARETHPGEEPQGVTVCSYNNVDKQSGFRFTVPQAWAGPTRIQPGAVCEFTATGAFPAGSDVAIEAGGSLTLAGANQSVASLTLGAEGAVGRTTLNLKKNVSLTAQSLVRVNGSTLAFNLFETATDNGANNILKSATPLTTAGTYTLLTVPAAQAADLTALAASATVLNAAAGTSYAFAVTTTDETASLTVTVAAAPALAPVTTEENETKTIETATALTGDLTISATNGATVTVSAPVTGTATLTTNPQNAGAGTVALGDSLAGFEGVLANGGGTTSLSDLSFVDGSFDWLIGPGTLWYTGGDVTVPGLTVASGAGHCGELKLDHDVTILSADTTTGALCKSGAGNLILKGNGSFFLGNNNAAYATGKPGNVPQPNGDGRTLAYSALMVSDGKIVVGTKDDPTDAPNVTVGVGVMVGPRTTQTDGEVQTAGAFEMNNGSLYVTEGIYLSYYCGLLGTTPADTTLRPKFTMNGGFVDTGFFTIMQDWEGGHTTSPELEINGGELKSRGNLSFAHQLVTNGLDTVCRINVNDGQLNVGGNILCGNAAGGSKSVFTLNGGEVLCRNNFTIGNNATAGRAEVYLNGGALRTRNLNHTGAANATDAGSGALYCRGGVIYPGYARAAGSGITIGGDNAQNRFEIYSGEGGLVLDFTEWASVGEDTGCVEFRNPVLRDPDCSGVDGGIWLRGGRVMTTFRSTMNGSTFTGPVRTSDRATLGVDNSWTGFKDRTFLIEAGSCLRASQEYMYINNVTLGTEGSDLPVDLNFCANRADIGLVVSNNLSILSPVTVTFHRPGGVGNIGGSQDGTYVVLVYPASLDDQVLLDKFVADPRTPEKAMTFTKQNASATGNWPGWKKVVVTIGDAATATGPVWTGAAGDSLWATAGNWDGVVPNARDAAAVFPEAHAGTTVAGDAMVGHLALAGGDGTGYTFTGAVNLNHTDFRTPPTVSAKSGTHTFTQGLSTDATYNDCNETDANGGRTGAIGVSPKEGAKIVVNGTVDMDAKRQLYVNPSPSGGGTTVLNATVAGAGVTVQSGTLEMSDLSKLNGNTLTIGPATFHYTGNGGQTTAKIVTSPGDVKRTSVMRLDGDLTVAGQMTASANGSLLKTGPGTLQLTYPGSVQLGGAGNNDRWNNTTTWPANGDSIQHGNGSFCLDEGGVVVGGPGQTVQLGGTSGNPDVFIGSQPRGWAYASDRVSFTMLDGTLNTRYLGIDHGMRRTDAQGNAIQSYVDWNQYGGVVNTINLYAGYELTSYDNHTIVNINLFGGQMNASGATFRFGQTYHKAGTGPDPHTYINIYEGASLVRTSSKRTDDIVHMPYTEDLGQLNNCQGRAPDATLNLYGGAFTNVYLFLVGHNGGSATLNLHGGVLNCENIRRVRYVKGQTDNNTYRVWNNKEGTVRIFWNGGTFMPNAEKLDLLASDANNATLSDLNEVLVSTNGAKLSTATLAADLYTIAQPLLHDPDLAETVDGGLTKTGAKPLALTGANTYNGPTVVAEGTLAIPANADANAIPAASAVSVAPDATLEFAEGTSVRMTKLAVDATTGAGSFVNVRTATEGALYLTNVTEAPKKGDILSKNASGRFSCGKWRLYADGEELTNHLVPVLVDGQLVLGQPSSTAIIIR